jgi:hypothetical protein
MDLAVMVITPGKYLMKISHSTGGLCLERRLPAYCANEGNHLRVSFLVTPITRP